MIKRIISIITVILLLATPALSMPKKPLPTIELKGVKLRGTAVSGIVTSIAIIEDTTTNRNYWYKIGDQLCGGKIVQIHRGAIVLDMNGKLYLFGLPQGAIISSSDIALSQRGLQDERELILGKKTGDNTWEVKMDSAIEMLTNVSRIMKEARIRPYFAIGKAAGIRIDRIKGESVIKKMGLKDGDVIKGVNGFGLMSPTKIFEAYRKYRNNRLIQLQLLREDEPVTLTYNILR